LAVEYSRVPAIEDTGLGKAGVTRLEHTGSQRRGFGQPLAVDAGAEPIISGWRENSEVAYQVREHLFPRLRILDTVWVIKFLGDLRHAAQR
jgi:hypothetical protein